MDKIHTIGSFHSIVAANNNSYSRWFFFYYLLGFLRMPIRDLAYLRFLLSKNQTLISNVIRPLKKQKKWMRTKDTLHAFPRQIVRSEELCLADCLERQLSYQHPAHYRIYIFSWLFRIKSMQIKDGKQQANEAHKLVFWMTFTTVLMLDVIITHCMQLFVLK